MIDREKIVKIIEKNGTYNGRSLSFDYYVIQPDDLAKALIAAGIGDIAEWKAEAEYWEKICKFGSDEHHTTIKNAVEHARHLMQERDEYKHRAEVAERALEKIATYCAIEDFDCFSLTSVAIEARAKELYNGWVQQAERELAKGKKDD